MSRQEELTALATIYKCILAAHARKQAGTNKEDARKEEKVEPGLPA
jgi:hypothetical protein